MENLEQVEQLADITFLEGLLQDYAIPWLINIALALLIFVVGRMVVGLLSRVVRKVLARAKLDDMLVDFISGLVRSVLLALVIIAALDQLGVDTTSLIAVLGAAGLAIGLALKDSLNNFASGVLLILFRPFKTGDFIEAAGVAGAVEKITIFSTVVKTGDNKEVIVPNAAIYGGVITNYSARETRRIDMVFGIGYGDDIRKARDVMRKVIDADERVLKDPEVTIAVSELADSSVNFVVRPWVRTEDYWAVRFDLTERIKLAFDEEGISIPYPQLDLHMERGAA